MKLSELEVLNLHAQGGMAEVYRARVVGADGFERHYAVKKILPHFTKDKELVRMFVEEARVAACLNFPNIVQVFDLCVSETGEYFIVMEFADGRDLADIIWQAGEHKTKLPVAMAVQVARDVLLALDYAHNAQGPDGRALRLIHRDISPHNIIVTYEGDVKLTDFGIAKVAQSANQTMAGVIKGKFGYMSPEQARGRPLDNRSDLYNVGICLYEMITGERLFAGASDLSTLDRMRAALVPEIPAALACPPALTAVIRRALEKDPQQRPASAAAMERELMAVAVQHRLVPKRPEIAAVMRELFAADLKDREQVPRQTRMVALKSELYREDMDLRGVGAPRVPRDKAPAAGPAVGSSSSASSSGSERPKANTSSQSGHSGRRPQVKGRGAARALGDDVPAAFEELPQTEQAPLPPPAARSEPRAEARPEATRIEVSRADLPGRPEPSSSRARASAAPQARAIPLADPVAQAQPEEGSVSANRGARVLRLDDGPTPERSAGSRPRPPATPPPPPPSPPPAAVEITAPTAPRPPVPSPPPAPPPAAPWTPAPPPPPVWSPSPPAWTPPPPPPSFQVSAPVEPPPGPPPPPPVAPPVMAVPPPPPPVMAVPPPPPVMAVPPPPPVMAVPPPPPVMAVPPPPPVMAVPPPPVMAVPPPPAYSPVPPPPPPGAYAPAPNLAPYPVYPPAAPPSPPEGPVGAEMAVAAAEAAAAFTPASASPGGPSHSSAPPGPQVQAGAPSFVRRALPSVWASAALAVSVVVAGAASFLGAAALGGGGPAVDAEVRTLWVRSHPPGATAVLDGTRLPGTTPLVWEGVLAPGEHSVQLGLGAGAPVQRKVNVRSGDRVVVVSETLLSSGSVEVITRPAGAQLLLDGRAVGQSPVVLEGIATDKTHTLEARLEGYRFEVQQVPVDRPAKHTMTLTLRPAGELGEVVILTSPPGEVWLDGAPWGTTSDVARPCPVGEHDITVRVPGVAVAGSYRIVVPSKGVARYFFDVRAGDG